MIILETYSGLKIFFRTGGHLLTNKAEGKKIEWLKWDLDQVNPTGGIDTSSFASYACQYRYCVKKEKSNDKHNRNQITYLQQLLASWSKR